jgi:type I thyroxine 5'-deiodinase
MPIAIDLMINECEKTYSAFPERLYIVQDGKVVYVGGVGPFDYKVCEVEDWLKKTK